MKKVINRYYFNLLMENAGEVTPTVPEGTPDNTIQTPDVSNNTPDVSNNAGDKISDPVTDDDKSTTPEVDVTALSEELERIKAENEKLKSEMTSKGQAATESLTKVQTDLEAIKSSKETIEAKAAAYEKVLTDMVEAKLADVPETIKALMPKSATITEQLDWIAKAEESGIIKKQIEIGKPMNPSVAKDFVDTTGLSVSQKMAMAYSSRK